MSAITPIRTFDATEAVAPGMHGSFADKVAKFKWNMQDTRGELEWVDKTLLCIDATYQRERISQTRVLAFAKSWSWIGCGTLTVARRPDGLLVVIDGQHRWLAANKRSDITHLPCNIFDCGDVRQEARGFSNANVNRGAISSYEKFRAELAAGNLDAIAINELVISTGYRFVAAGSGNDSNAVCCVAAIMAWHQKGKAICETAWRTACDVAAGKLVHGEFFRALAFTEWHLIKRNVGQSITDDRNMDTMRRVGVDQIMEQIRKAKGYYGKGGERVAAEGLITVLNKGRSTRRIPSTDPSSNEE